MLLLGSPIPSLVVFRCFARTVSELKRLERNLFATAALHEGLNNSNQVWESLLVSYSSLAAIS